jgi:2-haloacid dehalogenase
VAAEKLLDIRVLAFDLFGTVVDWRSGVISEFSAIARDREVVVDAREVAIDAGAFADAWRRRARELLDRVAQRKMRYRIMDDVHRLALDELAKKFALSLSEAERERLVSAWHRLPAWPDAVTGLNRLRAAYVVTTLSNGGLAHQVHVARFATLPFDCILATELVKTYKPDPRVYQLVPSLFHVPAERVMMVASHPYDLAAAAGQGFRTAFVSRPQEWGDGKPEEPDFSVDIAANDFLDLAAKLST